MYSSFVGRARVSRGLWRGRGMRGGGGAAVIVPPELCSGTITRRLVSRGIGIIPLRGRCEEDMCIFI